MTYEEAFNLTEEERRAIRLIHVECLGWRSHCPVGTFYTNRSGEGLFFERNGDCKRTQLEGLAQFSASTKKEWVSKIRKHWIEFGVPCSLQLS